MVNSTERGKTSLGENKNYRAAIILCVLGSIALLMPACDSNNSINTTEGEPPTPTPSLRLNFTPNATEIAAVNARVSTCWQDWLSGEIINVADGKTLKKVNIPSGGQICGWEGDERIPDCDQAKQQITRGLKAGQSFEQNSCTSR